MLERTVTERGRTRPVDGDPRSHGHGDGLVLTARRPRRGPCRGGPELSRVRLHPVRAPGDRRSLAGLRLQPVARPALAAGPWRVAGASRAATPVVGPGGSSARTGHRLADGGLVWGWHGDLDEVPAGFCTTLGIYVGDSAAELLDRWGTEVRGERPHRSRDANPILSHLSYWTDNGAAYWYRTEAGRTIGASVAEAVEALRADDVPVRAIELDSWCYQHEVPRPIAEIGYPEEVPPSGLMRWEPRVDAFDPPSPGRDPIEQLADRLGRPPLVIHSRHISPQSPYLDGGGVVGRRTRGPPCRPGVLPPMVRRCTPLGCVRDRAGLDAPLLVRCPSPARRTGPGCRVAARARCAGRRARRRADLVHGHAGGHRARGHARSRRRGADQRRLPLRRGPRVCCGRGT